MGRAEGTAIAEILMLSRGPVRLFRQQSGLFYARNGTPVRVGVPGMADIGGTVRVPCPCGRSYGVAVQLEVKARDKGGRAPRLEPEQDAWAAMTRALGAAHATVSCVAEAEDLLRRMAAGEWVA